jgi:zinc transport system permease protein
MAFFADAVSHTAFTGVAAGLLLSIDPVWTMPGLALLFGLLIVAMQRRSTLSSDTVVGVLFSAVLAFGLAVVSRNPAAARDVQKFLYGDILMIGHAEVIGLILLAVAMLPFQVLAYNSMIYIGVNPTLATAHRVRVGLLQYLFAALLALIVIFSVRAVGVLLVTALLVVPAATARNFARSAGAMFWWSFLVGITSAVAGLLLSAQDSVRTATGATIILCCFAWFVLSVLFSVFLRRGNRQIAL